MKVYVVNTEDGEQYAFSDEKVAKKFLNEAMADYARECGMELYEAHDFGYIEELEVDKYG